MPAPGLHTRTLASAGDPRVTESAGPAPAGVLRDEVCHVCNSKSAGGKAAGDDVPYFEM